MLDTDAGCRTSGRRGIGGRKARSDFGQSLDSRSTDKIVFRGGLAIHHLNGSIGISEIIRIKNDEVRRSLRQNLMTHGEEKKGKNFY